MKQHLMWHWHWHEVLGLTSLLVCSFFFNQRWERDRQTDWERETGRERGRERTRTCSTQFCTDAKIHGVGQELSTKLQKWGLEKVHVIPQKNVPGDLAVVLVAFPVSM